MAEETGRSFEPREGLLGRLGDFAYYRGEIILVIAMVVIAVSAWAGLGVFDAVKPFGFQDPGSESAEAERDYEEAVGVEPAPGAVLIVHSRSPRTIAGFARHLDAVPGIARVATGLDAGLRPGISRDGRSVLVLGYLGSGVEDNADVGANVQGAFAGDDRVELGGTAVAQDQLNSRSEHDLRRAELIALPILFLLTLWVFRGVVAALFPVGVAASSIVIGLAILRGLAEIVDIDVFAINLVSALGLGLALDYCLFIVSRYREELEVRGPGPAALIRTMQTAGRTVAFSSLTIAGCLATLLVFPQRFLYSMGIGGAIIALLSGLIALTVAPAVLTPLGPRINSLAPQLLQRRETGHRGWYRLAQLVMRRPLPIALATAAVMIVIGLPFLRVELTLADARTLPEDTSARQVDTALRKDFGFDPGATITVLVPAEGSSRQLARGVHRLRNDPAVAAVRSGRAAGGLREVDVQLAVNSSSDGAVDLVEKARRIHWGAPALVGGRSAELLDQRDSIGSHLPLALALIACLTYLLLLLMTGSVVLPLQALVMNLLTVSVALGVMVFVFQDGRLMGLLDYSTSGGIDRSVPILLFALVFGLSTDYGIFVITRIQEQRARARSDSEAIASGLERSARIVTAAALLLSVAIGALALSSLVFNKQLAIGAAAGILVDATLVRALLFPAVMRLCGRWTWWAPRWLRSRANPNARRSSLSDPA